jgi:hypothetical protein
MALQFKQYVPKESTLTDLGTVASQIPGGKISFTPGTLAKYQAGNIKSMSMLLTDKQGLTTTLPLSVRVSSTVKNALANGATKNECLNAIVKLNIVETDKGANIISAPRGEGGEEETVAITTATKTTVAYEDLIAY